MSQPILQLNSTDPNTSSATTSLAFISNITAGSTILVLTFLNFSSLGATPVQDSLGNTYTQVTKSQSATGPGNQTLYLYAAYNSPGGPNTVQLNIAGAATIRPLLILEIGGTAAAPLDGSAHNDQTSPGTGAGGVTSGTATSAGQPALAVAFSVPIFSNAVPSAVSPYTSQGTFWSNSATGRIETRSLTGTGSQQATFTATAGTTEHLSLIVVLDAAPTMALVGASGSAGVANVTSVATPLGTGSGSVGVVSLYDSAAAAFISGVGASGSAGAANVVAAGPVGGPPTLTGPIPNQASVVGTFVTPLDVSGFFSGETTWAVVGGVLPPGLSLAGSVFSGKPTAPGVYAGIIVRASNAFGGINQGPFTWTIQSLPTDIFPSYLPGITWDIVRQPTWKTAYQEALSGKASTQAYQQYPLWQWELHFSVLRDTLTPSEIRQLVGFFNSVKGRYGTFRYFDPDFNTVISEPFGTGDAITHGFQLIANYAVAGGPGSPDIVQNLANTPNVYNNGSLVSPAAYSIGVTGIITFLSPPGIGRALTWDGSFYYRCRFLADDGMAPSQFMYRLWELQSLKFRSVIL